MIRRLLFQNFAMAHGLGVGLRRRVSPLGRLLLLVGLLAGVFGFDTRGAVTYQWFTLLFALFGLSFLWSGFSRRGFPSLSAERRLPRHGTVGEPLRYSLNLLNPGRHAQRGLSLLELLDGGAPSWQEFRTAVEPVRKRRNLFDRYVGYYKWEWLLRERRGASVEERPLPDLPPGQAVTVAMELLPQRRGRLRFAELCFCRPDPFGLFRTLHHIALPQSCCVLPRRYPVSPLPIGGSRAYQRGGVALANHVGESEEFTALREYRPGDSVRHVHWRSSAKLGRWVVKEYQDEYFTRRALVLDTFCPAARTADFEAAVSVAASLVLAAPEREALLDLMFVEREAHCFTAGRGLDHAASLLEILAGVQISQRTPFAALAQNVLGRAGQLSSVALVLLDLDAERRQLCEALAARGLPVAALVVGEQPLAALPRATMFLRQIRPSRLEADLLWP